MLPPGAEDPIQGALSRCDQLRELITQTEARRFPGRGAKQLLGLITAANEEIVKELSGPIPTPDVGDSVLRSSSKLLDELHRLLEHLEGAAIEEAPVAMVAPFDSLLRSFFDDVAFIMRSRPTYEYAVEDIGYAISEVFKGARYEFLLDEFPDRFLLVDCPVTENRNSPINSMVAHEAAHGVFSANNLGKLLEAQLAQPSEDDPAASYFGLNELWKERSDVVSNWLKELSCDAIALATFGAAYLFAYIHFSRPFGSIDDATDSHPPDRVRIAFLCEMLLNEEWGLGYQNAFEPEVKTVVADWFQRCSLDEFDVEGVIHRSALVAIKPLLTAIGKESLSAVGNNAFRPDDFLSQVPHLVTNLLHGAPMNEYMLDDGTSKFLKRAHHAAILNAGWLALRFETERLKLLFGTEDVPAIASRVFGIVEKSLEYVDIQTRWSPEGVQ